MGERTGTKPVRPGTLDYEYELFVKTVQHKAELSWDDAERAAQATLETLAERLSAGQARDIAKHLPAGVRPWLRAEGKAEPFHADEFLRRVAEREDVDLETAEQHARAVFAALGRFVKVQELADMAAELPKDFEPLLAVAEAEAEPEPEEFLPAEEFVRRVADRAGIDVEPARRATDAVLEALAERIAGGEVEDLAAQLAAELRPPLVRGMSRTGGKATRMSLEEFLERIAELEGGGVDLEQAEEHARAVFATLREAVTEKEFGDMKAELPDEYRPLLGRG